MFLQPVAIFTAFLLLSLPVAASSPAQKAFNDFSKLVGVWQGDYANGKSHQVSYKLTANNTVLVETWTMSATRESMTLYALDGDRLIATHYCPQGNQPRLSLVGKAKAGKYQFHFLDGTNLQDANGAHQHAFWLQLDSANHFSRSETYIKNSARESTAEDIGETVVYRRLDQK